jgi:hypothetical protein
VTDGERPERPWDTIADGIPRTEEQAKRAGIPWDLCRELNARQAAVAACRRRAERSPILKRKLD